MTALAQEIVVKVVADVHRAEQTISLVVEQKEDGIGDFAVRLGFDLEIFEVVVEIVVIVFEYRPRRVICVVDLLIGFPLVYHLAELLFIFFCQFYKS